MNVNIFSGFGKDYCLNLKLNTEFNNGNLIKSLYEAVQEKFNLDIQEFVLVSSNGIKLVADSNIENGQRVQICPTVFGGKGGFGSLLRAFGKQMQQSTNKEACRDLSGRRIRHVNNEKKLKEFVQKQEELAKEKELKKLEKAKKRKQKRDNLEHSHHLFVDPQYDRQKEKIANDIDEAVTLALKKKKAAAAAVNESGSSGSSDREEEEPTTSSKAATSPTSNKEKDLASSTSENKDNNKLKEKSTKDTLYGDWMGCGDLEVSSSDSDQEEEQPVKKKVKN